MAMAPSFSVVAVDLWCWHHPDDQAADLLAYFDRPNTINGPTEAVDVPTRTPPRRARTARVRFIRPAQLLRQ